MSYIAKSIILDIADNYGDTSSFGLRAIDFYNNGSKLSITSYTAYATTEVSSHYGVSNIFNTTLNKIGGSYNTEWWSENITPQRVIIIFDTPQIFDEIKINNRHNYGVDTNIGVKNVVIHTSEDAITDITYDAFILNSAVIFDGHFNEHVGLDEEDEQVLNLELPTIVTNLASNVTTSSVTCNGSLNSFLGESSVKVYFELGIDTNYGNTTSIQIIDSVPTNFDANMSGLVSFTEYHYRAVVTNDSEYWHGIDMTFVTANLYDIDETQSEFQEGTLTDVIALDNDKLSFLSSKIPVSAITPSTTLPGNDPACNESDSGVVTNVLDGDVLTNINTKTWGNGYVELAFNESYVISKIKLHMRHTNPNESITKYRIDYYNGTTWVTPSDWDITGASVINEWATHVLSTPINTTEIRIYLLEGSCCSDDYCMVLNEVEVYTVGANQGNRLSPQFDLSSLRLYLDSLIEWIAEEPIGSSVTIETRYSLDGGSNWSNWSNCTNNTAIPGLSTDDDLSNALLECKQTLSTNEPNSVPVLDRIAVYFSGTFSRITTNPATNVAISSAILNGTLDNLVGESSVNVYFEWGIDTNYGNITIEQSLNVIGAFSDNVSGLAANQTYHFRAVITDGVNIWYGDDVSFTTILIGVDVSVEYFTVINNLTGAIEFNQIFIDHFQITNSLQICSFCSCLLLEHFQDVGTLTFSLFIGTPIVSEHFQITCNLIGLFEHNEVITEPFQTINNFISSFCLSVLGTHHQSMNHLTGTFIIIKYRNYINVFKFFITGEADGVEDMEIPITSFQIRMYSDKNSFLSVVVPSLNFVNIISTRSNGTLKLKIVYVGIDKTEIRSEVLLETAFESLRVDEGVSNQSVSLSGYETEEMADARQTNPKTITLDAGWINYRRSNSSKWTIRLVKPLLDLRAGDTVIDNSVAYTVDNLTWVNSDSVQQMEISG